MAASNNSSLWYSNCLKWTKTLFSVWTLTAFVSSTNFLSILCSCYTPFDAMSKYLNIYLGEITGGQFDAKQKSHIMFQLILYYYEYIQQKKMQSQSQCSEKLS